MNIWILNHYAVSPDISGGTRHYDLGKELVERNYNVIIFASSFHYSQHREMKLVRGERWKLEEINGVKFIWLKTFSYQKNDWRRVLNMVSYSFSSYLLGRKITRIEPSIFKPDVIIGSSVHLLAVLSAYCLSKYYRAKFIMEVRDLWPQTLIDLGALSKNNLFIRDLRALEKFLYKRAKRIITLLPKASNYIANYRVNREKIVWIPNGVDLERFKNIKKEKLDSQFRVLYLGAFGRTNALDIVLKAAKIIQDEGYKEIKFALVGDGEEKLKLVRQKERLNLKNVEFGNPISKDNVPEFLQKADVALFNLAKVAVFKYGISSNKLFDYLASGKPIVFSVNAPNRIIEESGCGISIPPEEPETMAKAIIQLYRTPLEEREEMGRKGREYVEKYHSIPVLVDKLEKVIQEIT